MKKTLSTIIGGLILLAAIWLLAPIIAAAFTPRTSYYPPALVTAVPTDSPVTTIPIIQPVETTAAPVVVQSEPTRDWQNDITLVNNNLETAITIMETCAIAKVQEAAQFKVLDCQPALDHMEDARQRVQDLQSEIEASGGMR